MSSVHTLRWENKDGQVVEETRVTLTLECSCCEKETEIDVSLDDLSEISKLGPDMLSCSDPACKGEPLCLFGSSVTLEDFGKALDGSKRMFALVCWLIENDEDFDTVETSTWDDTTFEIGSGEYRVLTDEEADQAFDEYMDGFIDECVLSEIPEKYRCYFDYELFKEDVKGNDGRGPSLASYDGEENETKVNGSYWFIYRTN